MLHAFYGAVSVEFQCRTRGLNRRDLRHTKFHRFLYDEIHLIGGCQCLHQRDADRRFAFDGIESGDRHDHIAFTDTGDGRRKFAAHTIEQSDCFTWRNTQHVQMSRHCFTDVECLPV